MPIPESPVTRALRADPTVFALHRLPPHSSHAFAFADGRPCVLSLNGEWDFRYTERAGTPFGPWGRVTVPGHFQLAGGPEHPYGVPQYTNCPYPWDGWEAPRPGELPAAFDPVGEYRRAFTLPEGWKNCFIRFEGADAALELFCNGRFAGYSESSFDTAEFDLTPFVRGGENELVARVYRFCSGSWLEDQDFWRMSGLFRPVTLFTKPAVHIEDLRVGMAFAPGYRAAEVRFTARLAGTPAGDVTLALAGQTVTAPAAPCVELAVTIDAPHLWSAEDPYLYTAVLTTADEMVTVPVGVREFCLRGGLMCLNGRRIVFKGVDRHEWSAERGRAISYAETEWDIVNLKRHNVNAIRTSHYPDNTFLYELCDRYGLYVIDEANLETHGTWQNYNETHDTTNILPNDRPEWRDAVLARAAALQERDKLHPCVLLWSCGNESFGGSNLRAMHDRLAAGDSSRLVHYEGIFNDRRYPGTSDIESQMYTPAAKVEQFLQEHPEKPFILCEYVHAMGNSLGAMERYTELAYREPRYQGGFIWEYMDHALWQARADGSRRLVYGGDFGDRPSDYEFCCDGLVTGDRRNTAKMATAAAAYQPFAITVDGQTVRIENRTLFTDLDAFTLRFTLAKDGETVSTLEARQALAPGQALELAPGLVPPREPGIHTFTLEVLLREAAPWAPAGHVVARGQGAFEVPAPAPARTPAVVCRGVMNFGVQAGALQAQIGRKQGSLTSLRLHGRELLTAPAELTLWRAPTCNDTGAGFEHAFARWAQAGRYARVEAVEAVTENAVRTVWRLATDSAEPVEALWQFYGNELAVTLTWRGPKAEVPAFGLQLPLLPGYDRLAWLGLGPAETMPDRTLGAWFGRFEEAVDADGALYMMPQEHGAHCGVRHARLAAADGSLPALGFASAAGMLLSATAHTPHELENARHTWQLPPRTQTVMRCLAGQRGAAGDDSWGALPHPEYRYTLRPGSSFTFRLGLV